MTKYRVCILILCGIIGIMLWGGVYLHLQYKELMEMIDISADVSYDENLGEESAGATDNSGATVSGNQSAGTSGGTGITDLKNHINGLNSQISNLNSQVSSLKGQVAALSDSNYGVKANGRLKVLNNKLCNQSGQPIQLKGMSTHGITWYPRYTGTATFNSLKDYGANVVRLAVYSEQSGSYTYEPEHNMDILYNAIGNALSVNMYVIVDWHVLKEGNPNKYKEKAKTFFKEISSYYGDNPAIIYEICNEPNSSKTPWSEIKAYANEIIPIIRKNAPNSLIIVGTPGFSYDVEEAAKDPLKFDNVMYAFHPYVDVSYSDTSDMNWMERKLTADIPIIVTEWGISTKGATTLHEARAMKLVEVMKKHNISWCMWALSNKDEEHSMFKTTCNKYSDWTESDLTFSGKVAVKALKY